MASTTDMATTPEAGSEYYAATRHPWAAVVFVLPLLMLYEAGLLSVATGQSDFLRNGTDTWLRWLFARVGLEQSFWPGLLLGISLLAWSWWQRSEPLRDIHNVWMGMVMESALFALGLWGISRILGTLVHQLGLPLLYTGPEPAVQKLISFLGAGIYEEAIFRLLLFSTLIQLFTLAEFGERSALGWAVLLSSLLFAAAHHIGPAGESFQGFAFLFRTIAGIYFALLYQLRGFGIAVGAHAGYDVLVGVILPAA